MAVAPDWRRHKGACTDTANWAAPATCSLCGFLITHRKRTMNPNPREGPWHPGLGGGCYIAEGKPRVTKYNQHPQRQRQNPGLDQRVFFYCVFKCLLTWTSQSELSASSRLWASDNASSQEFATAWLHLPGGGCVCVCAGSVPSMHCVTSVCPVALFLK